MDSRGAMDGSAGARGDALEAEPYMEPPPKIGSDERRMHVRAYNYWVSLLDGRDFPSIADLDPASIGDFGPNSVLLDFGADPENPGVPWLGKRLREEGGLEGDVRTIADVPRRSLVSRLTDHHLQILANRAPVGFEAEFENVRGNNTLYRGILMPFSSNGESIDFIYGVINWKEMVDARTAADIVAGLMLNRAPAPAPTGPIWADGPSRTAMAEAPAVPEPGEDLRPGDLDAYDEDADRLYETLAAARETAETARGYDGRSRAALYRALGLAYDFALVAAARPDDYAELLEDAGLTAQARAPMTPIVKLVFGAGYDKTRLAEFAAALAWARRAELGVDELRQRIEAHPGGLKAIVTAERAMRRPAHRPHRLETAQQALRATTPLATVRIGEGGAGEFVLLVARRAETGLEVLATLDGDSPLIDRAIVAAHR